MDHKKHTKEKLSNFISSKFDFADRILVFQVFILVGALILIFK